MSKPKNDDTPKIKEFQWIEIETKVREIMVELLQPFNKKQTEESIKTNEIKRNIEFLKKKIQDHDFLLTGESGQKPTYIQAQDNKIQTLTNLLTEHRLQTEIQLKKMQGVQQLFQERVRQVNNFQNRLDRQIEQRGKQFMKYKDSLDRQLELLTKKQDSHFQQMYLFKSNSINSINKMQTKMITFDNKLRQLEDATQSNKNHIKKLLQSSNKHYEDIYKLQAKASNFQLRISDREKDTRLSQKFLSYVKEIKNDYNFLARYIQKYQPLYVQTAISEALHCFVQGKNRIKLAIYEQRKYADLHYSILSNENRNLQQQMQRYSINIRKITTNNKKYLINMAVVETKNYGGHIYQFRIQDSLQRLQIQERTRQNQKQSLTIEQVNSLINEKMSKVMPSKQMADIDNQLGPMKQWMKQLQEQSIIRLLEYDKKYEQLNKKIIEYEIKNQLSQKQLNSQINQLRQNYNLTNNNIVYYKQNLKELLNFMSVINHIAIQDQIDRQNTALYALKSNNKANIQYNQLPMLQLDPKCLNCQNKNSLLIQEAFKMACLTYNPSQIKIDEQLFSREQILQLSTGILQNLKNKFSKIDGGKSNVMRQYATINNDKPMKYQKIHSQNEIKTSRKGSFHKQGSLLSRDNSKSKQIQSLFPLLGNISIKGQKKQKKNNLSVFY